MVSQAYNNRCWPVINLIVSNLPAGFWFSDNRLVLDFQNLITYLDDLVIIIIIQVGYQSPNINLKN